jgi:hypothetical protein
MGGRTSIAEPGSADLSRAVRVGLQRHGRSHHILGHLLLVDLVEHLAALVVISRIAAQGCEAVGRKCHEVGQGKPPRDILNMRVQTRFSWITITPGNFVTVSERVSALIGRTRYRLMLPLPLGEGTVS